MKPRAMLIAIVGLLILVPSSKGDNGCRYMKSRNGLSGYESGGPYALDHFLLTKGRIDLREFLWTHWHDHKKGVAEAEEMTVDRGLVKVLYMIQPDAQGHWFINVEVDRPLDPPCTTFSADSLVRLQILNPEDDISQTKGLWPPDEIPKRRVADSKIANSKSYRVVLVRSTKPAGDVI